jgi:hypothetical protein
VRRSRGIEGQVQRTELVRNDGHQCRAATEEFEPPRVRALPDRVLASVPPKVTG